MSNWTLHKRGCNRCRQGRLCGQGRAILIDGWTVPRSTGIVYFGRHRAEV